MFETREEFVNPPTYEDNIRGHVQALLCNEAYMERYKKFVYPLEIAGDMIGVATELEEHILSAVELKEKKK